MTYNYSKLIGRIIEKYGTRATFANRLGISEKSLSDKLNNKRIFKQSEIAKAVSLLDIEEKSISQYFFTLNVQNN